MSTIGALSILKMGLEQVRLRKPPYPVAFDESGDKTINMTTVEAFIPKAEKIIADADSVLRAQVRHKT